MDIAPIADKYRVGHPALLVICVMLALSFSAAVFAPALAMKYGNLEVIRSFGWSLSVFYLTLLIAPYLSIWTEREVLASGDDAAQEVEGNTAGS